MIKVLTDTVSNKVLTGVKSMARLSVSGLARTLLMVRALDQELIEKTPLDWCEVYGQAVC